MIVYNLSHYIARDDKGPVVVGNNLISILSKRLSIVGLVQTIFYRSVPCILAAKLSLYEKDISRTSPPFRTSPRSAPIRSKPISKAGATGRCYQLVATTLPMIATSLLGLVISPFGNASNLTVMVVGRQ